jgi:hypothetical protein
MSRSSMSNETASQEKYIAPKALFLANLCFWSYFWIVFSAASYPFRPDPLGHPAGAGYTFWGHSIAVVESAFKYPFFTAMFWVEFPSFATANLVVRLSSPHSAVLNSFCGGVSGAGWLLFAVMVLSFPQWWFLGWAGERLWRRAFHMKG